VGLSSVHVFLHKLGRCRSCASQSFSDSILIADFDNRQCHRCARSDLRPSIRWWYFEIMLGSSAESEVENEFALL